MFSPAVISPHSLWWLRAFSCQVNGKEVLARSYQDIFGMIKTAGRPITLSFIAPDTFIALARAQSDTPVSSPKSSVTSPKSPSAAELQARNRKTNEEMFELQAELLRVKKVYNMCTQCSLLAMCVPHTSFWQLAGWVHIHGSWAMTASG